MRPSDTDHKSFANPGKYYEYSVILDRGYSFHRRDSEKFNAKTCHIPEGGRLLSVYISDEIRHDNNMIVFYAFGEEEEIVAEYRIKPKDSNSVYILSIPYIEKVTRYGKLPPIFDSPYGRWVENNRDFTEAVVAGNDRLILNVYQQASDGNKTPRDGQPFLLEFKNGEVALAMADGEWNRGYTIPILLYVNPENEESKKKAKYQRENLLYEAWVKEEGIENHNLPKPVVTIPPEVKVVTTPEPLPEFTLFQRALNWVQSFGK